MKERRSEIDATHKITENRWVLTIARKTNGSHQQHTFLIVEGIEDERAVIWFMDLVGQRLTPFLPNILDARIRIEPFSTSSEHELEEQPLLFRCKREMMDVQPEDTLASLTWFIEKEDAIRLISTMKKDKEKPPVFNILGKDSRLTGSSAKSSSKERGHNCFTYAKEKISNLKVEHIRVPGSDLDYYIEQIACISNLTLKAPRRRTAYCPYFNKKTAIVGFSLALIGTAAAIEATRRYYSTP